MYIGGLCIHVKEYCTIIGNNTWTHNPPIYINSYDTTSANATEAVRVVKEAEWKRKLTALKTFNGACEGAKELIIYGVGEDAFVVIKQQYVGYGGVTPKKMMQHML